MDENIKFKDMIELIYQAEEEVLDGKIKQVNKKIRDKINNINLEKVLEDTSKPNELKKVFEQIEENYSIKIAEYNKEIYRQGFIDGINLMMNCLK